MNKKITVVGANTVFFVFVVLFLVFQIMIIAVGSILGKDLINSNTYVYMLVNEYLLILLPCLIYIGYKRLSLKEVLRLNKLELLPALMIVLISIPAYIAAMAMNNILIILLDHLGSVPNTPLPIPKNLPELITGILVVGVTPAICEEVLNRGIMLSAYENRGTVKAMVISSILFGIFHFDITNLLGPIFLGLVIAYYVIRTNSIFAGMLAHFLNNTIAELLQYFFRNIPQQQDAGTSANGIVYLFIWGGVSLFAVWFLLKAFNKITPNRSIFKPRVSGIGGDISSILTHWPIIVVLLLYTVLAMTTILLIMST